MGVVGILAVTMAQGMRPPFGGPGGFGPQQIMQQAMVGVLLEVLQTYSHTVGVTALEAMQLSGGEKTFAEVAQQLRTDGAKLEAALVEARNQAIDQSVADKTLTAEQAAVYKSRSTAVIKALLQTKPKMQFMPMGGLAAPGMGK